MANAMCSRTSHIHTAQDILYNILKGLNSSYLVLKFGNVLLIRNWDMAQNVILHFGISCVSMYWAAEQVDRACMILSLLKGTARGTSSTSACENCYRALQSWHIQFDSSKFSYICCIRLNSISVSHDIRCCTDNIHIYQSETNESSFMEVGHLPKLLVNNTWYIW